MDYKKKTIEEKAKRYDEAIERAKDFMNGEVHCALRRGENIMCWIFPELRESEDERTVKDIICYLRVASQYVPQLQKEEWIAWLEKQGEQKSLDDITKEVTKDKNTAISFLKSTGIINENGELADEYKIEQGEQKSQEEVDNLHNYLYGEQKSAWSEVDEENLNWFEKFFRAESVFVEGKDIPQDRYLWFKNLKDRVQPKQEWSEEDESLRRRCIGAIDMANLSDYTKDSLLNWLKSLKDRVQTKPKQEWSKDDEKMFNGIIEAATHHCYLNITDIDWLKSLKERYTWKPSDEQMQALSNAGNSFRPFEEGHKVLWSLYNDLKKLKGE